MHAYFSPICVNVILLLRPNNFFHVIKLPCSAHGVFKRLRLNCHSIGFLYLFWSTRNALIVYVIGKLSDFYHLLTACQLLPASNQRGIVYLILQTHWNHYRWGQILDLNTLKSRAMSLRKKWWDSARLKVKIHSGIENIIFERSLNSGGSSSKRDCFFC